MAQAAGPGDYATPKKHGGGARFNGFWRRKPAKTPGAVQPSSQALEEDAGLDGPGGLLAGDLDSAGAYGSPAAAGRSPQHNLAGLGEIPVDPRRPGMTASQLSFHNHPHSHYSSHGHGRRHSEADSSDEAARNPLNSSSFGLGGGFGGGPQLFDSPSLQPRSAGSASKPGSAASSAGAGQPRPFLLPSLSALSLDGDDDDFTAEAPAAAVADGGASPGGTAGRQGVLDGHMEGWKQAQSSSAGGGSGVGDGPSGAPGAAQQPTGGSEPLAVARNTPRLAKYLKLLDEPHVDLAALRELGWKGIPGECRDTVWKLLMGYLPAHKARRAAVLDRRRAEYQGYLEQYFKVAHEGSRSETEQALYRQVMVDVPRTLPHSRFFQSAPIQRSLERVLYTWGIRHPASGYVQGINDLAAPFYLVFASAVCGRQVIDTPCDPDLLSDAQVQDLEADVFWCLSKLLDWIQDHYIFAQPGIQRMVFKIQELVGRIDAELYQHLADQQLEFIQFAFRWVNCLLLRELTLPLIVRVWDTYLCEDAGGAGFQSFHAYVCAALLIQWSAQLKRMGFGELIVFLQHLPTQGWDIKHVETLLSQAYVYKTLYDDAPAHLQ